MRFEGPAAELENKDESAVIAIDALCAPGKYQYSKEGFERDLNKAYVGFMGVEPEFSAQDDHFPLPQEEL